MLSTIGPWLLASAVAATTAGADQPFDLVIHGGRVMHPLVMVASGVTSMVQ